MALSTVDADGAPDSRMVLLKDVDERGFTFYSNRESAKGAELAATPRAALLFHWKSLRRQVRVRGAVEPVSAAEADAYFASRARESRIGAWASDQSRPLASRAALEAAVARETARFEGQDVPRPERWTGWRVIPDAVEFWRDRPFRLHDRLLFTRDGDGWTPDAAAALRIARRSGPGRSRPRPRRSISRAAGGLDLVAGDQGHEEDGVLDHPHQLTRGPGRLVEAQVAIGRQIGQGLHQGQAEVVPAALEEAHGHVAEARPLGHHQPEHRADERIAHEAGIGDGEARQAGPGVALVAADAASSGRRNRPRHWR